MKIITIEYVRSHGKKPQGNSHWAYRLVGAPGYVDQGVRHFDGTLTALKANVQHNVTTFGDIVVLP